MTKENFKSKFIKSIDECIKFAKKFIIDELPGKIKINLYRRDKEEKFLRLDIDGALEKLYKDGEVPKWIDIAVVKVDEDYTIIACIYSDMFIRDDSMLQFAHDPLSPFQITGPSCPNAVDDFKNKKFNLREYDEEKGWPKRPITS